MLACKCLTYFGSFEMDPAMPFLFCFCFFIFFYFSNEPVSFILFFIFIFMGSWIY